MRSVLVASAFVILAAAFSSSSAQAGACPAGFTESRSPQAISTTNLTCATGRKVAAAVAQKSPAGCIASGKRQVTLAKPCRRMGFSCSAKASGRSLRITCAGGAKRLRFTY
jgi:hypothetical protein